MRSVWNIIHNTSNCPCHKIASSTKGRLWLASCRLDPYSIETETAKRIHFKLHTYTSNTRNTCSLSVSLYVRLSQSLSVSVSVSLFFSLSLSLSLPLLLSIPYAYHRQWNSKKHSGEESVAERQWYVRSPY